MKSKSNFFCTTIFAALIVSLGMIIGCTDSNAPADVETINYTAVPEGFPPIPFPKDNPITPEKVQLGRMLFYEVRLSRDHKMASCSHCMKPENTFSDNTQISLGIEKLPEYRNTMTIVNSAYRPALFWDGRGTSIESPAYRSLWLTQILGADTNVIARELSQDKYYPYLFKKAFGPDAKPSAYLISKAIATFVRTMVSGNSRYDKYIRGDHSVMNRQEKRGMELFFSERTRCSVCHSGFLFTDGIFHSTGIVTHYFDRGRWQITGDNKDRGKFITPTLRNVEYTGPYMHDGSVPTLLDVINHYNNGGKPFINKDTLLRPLNLNDPEKADLIAFLKTLTDHEFINNPRFKNPWLNEKGSAK